jgi:hypothetical protein
MTTQLVMSRFHDVTVGGLAPSPRCAGRAGGGGGGGGVQGSPLQPGGGSPEVSSALTPELLAVAEICVPT